MPRLTSEWGFTTESLTKDIFGEDPIVFRPQSKMRGTKKVRGASKKLDIQIERADARTRARGEVPFGEQIAAQMEKDISGLPSVDEQSHVS
jgi:hypothetical protein